MVRLRDEEFPCDDSSDDKAGVKFSDMLPTSDKLDGRRDDIVLSAGKDGLHSRSAYFKYIVRLLLLHNTWPCPLFKNLALHRIDTAISHFHLFKKVL